MDRRRCPDCGGKKAYHAKRCFSCHWRTYEPPRKWTKESIVAAIQRWAAEHDGVPPISRDWDLKGDYWPSKTSVYQQNAPFDSWNDAIAAAGFTPTKSLTEKRVVIDEELAARLRAMDVSVSEIAKRMGVSRSTLQKRLGPRPKPSRLRRRTREQRIADLRKALEANERRTS